MDLTQQERDKLAAALRLHIKALTRNPVPALEAALARERTLQAARDQQRTALQALLTRIERGQ